MDFYNSKDWWRNAVIYQVYPRSFQDTNDDGEGDLRGVIMRLPYLKDLGVDAIWLSPFYTSPNKDGGYDVSNPRDVDPRFGTLDDAAELIKKAHELQLKIIVDIVPNHFSTEHPWFKEAIASPKGSVARNKFHFYDGRGVSGDIPPNNWCSIFGGPAWSRVTEIDGSLGQWYLHLFDSTQADLNWDNDLVSADFEKTLHFWLELGVDGFRIDVAHGLVKDEIHKDHRDPENLTKALRLDVSGMSREVRESLLADVPFFDREGVHEIYRNWRKILDSYEGGRMSVAEAWVHPSIRATRYVRNDELHQIFNFDFLIAEWSKDFLITSITKTLNEVSQVSASPTWVLSNHDSPRVVSRLGSGEVGLKRARAMALLIQALPGSVYIYQGEELGLPTADVPDELRQDPVFFRTSGADKGRDGSRVPMPWESNSINFGFSSGRPWLPIPKTWRNLAADTQITSESTLSLYKKALMIRAENKSLKLDLEKNVMKSLNWLETENNIIGFKRKDDFVLFANTAESPCKISLNVYGITKAQLLVSSWSGCKIEGDSLYISGDSCVWLSL